MKLYEDKKWLYQKYWEEELSCIKIAKIYGFSKLTIWRQLKKFKINRRSQSEALKIPSTREIMIKNLGTGTLGKHLSEETKEKIRIAAFRRSPPSEETREKLRIAMKKRFEGDKTFNKNERHGNWRGGITPETQKRLNNKNWKKLKKGIYCRDNYTCQKCGKKNICLSVHHIIPFQYSLCDKSFNLITLCQACHGKEEFLFKKENEELYCLLNQLKAIRKEFPEYKNRELF